MSYSLCMMADFQNGLISRIFGVFSSCFLRRTPIMDFNMFFGILSFDSKGKFCMGYNLCMMADFLKKVSFLEYLMFFRAVFWTERF